MRQPPDTRHPAGFTLVELLMVVVIVMVLTFVAIPSLRSFTARDAALDVASSTARLVNKVKSQARQRNRAYLMVFSSFAGDRPQGWVEVREGNGPSCVRTAGDMAANTRLLRRFLYGGQPPPGGDLTINDTSETIPEVGLSGWMPPDGLPDNLRRNDLVICVKTDGAVVDAATLLPLTGRVRLVVQRFEGSGQGWALAEPGRNVVLTFGGQAHLELN
jgi:type II secretory pathway pseudopilin PulG